MKTNVLLNHLQFRVPGLTFIIILVVHTSLCSQNSSSYKRISLKSSISQVQPMTGIILWDDHEDHLFEIAEYIEKDSPFQAKRVVQLIIKETQRLKTNIRIGKIIQELRLDNYRELRIFNYRIMYKIISEKNSCSGNCPFKKNLQ